MSEKGLDSETKTGRINILILGFLDKQPEGIQWADLARAVKKTDPSVHPKTLNGCIWKLTEAFPDKVYKPSKGLFRLTRYRNSS